MLFEYYSWSWTMCPYLIFQFGTVCLSAVSSVKQCLIYCSGTSQCVCYYNSIWLTDVLRYVDSLFKNMFNFYSAALRAKVWTGNLLHRECQISYASVEGNGGRGVRLHCWGWSSYRQGHRRINRSHRSSIQATARPPDTLRQCKRRYRHPCDFQWPSSYATFHLHSKEDVRTFTKCNVPEE